MSIHQKDITVNIYASNIGIPKILKYTVTGFKGDIKNNSRGL